MTASTTQAPKAFTLSKGTTKVPAKVAYDAASSRKATLTPNTKLTAGTYTATISTTAKDTAGNALTEKKVWTFKFK